MKKIHERGFWLNVNTSETDYGNINQKAYMFGVGYEKPEYILWSQGVVSYHKDIPNEYDGIVTQHFARFLIKIGNDILRTQRKLNRRNK